ncbi:MAG: sodium/proline symporter, partial [Clostridia bacterium]|nr:sodium/proline symporter [Clostridia bacterium]
MNLEMLAFILYFVLVLTIGIIFFLRTRKDGDSEKQYFLGGRQMGPWVTALSAQASDMSAWLLMGLPGSVLAFGLGKAWIGIGLAIGTALNWIFVAKRLRKFSKAANDSITLPEYLQNRFLAKTPVLSIITAIVFLISFTIYVASGFVAGTTVFVSLVPSLSRETAMIIFAAVILLYTFLGGFKAVSWTDFFQGTLMFIALLAVPIVTVLVEDLDPAAVNTVYTNLNDGTEYAFVANVFSASWQDIVSGLAWGLGYFGMPHILVRFMAIRKPSEIKKSATIAIIWVTISLAASLIIAYLGRMVVAGELLPDGLQATVFIHLARRFFPPFLSGILLAAIIAASMSTADSQLLVASSSFTNDIYKPLIRKNASDKELVWV